MITYHKPLSKKLSRLKIGFNFHYNSKYWQISEFSTSRFFYPSRFFTHLIELVEMSKKLHITYPRNGLQNFLEIFKGSKKPIFRVSILFDWGSPQPSYRDMLYRFGILGKFRCAWAGSFFVKLNMTGDMRAYSRTFMKGKLQMLITR